MNNNSTVRLDSLRKSLTTVQSLDTELNSFDLLGFVINIEKNINNINFEHGNCIENYKEKIDYLLDEILNLKKDVSQLENMISKSIDIFSKNEDKDNELPVIIKTLQSAATDVSKTGIVENNQTSNSNYSTVPIGLGIATTGMVGAVGAVAISEMDDTKKSDFDYDYVPAESKDEVSVPKVDTDIKKEVFDSTNFPYHAIRDKSSLDKFYGEDDNS